MRHSSSWFFLLILAVSCVGAEPPAKPATPITSAAGAWSNPATWGGKLPDANSAVTIPAGTTVTLDMGVSVRSIKVEGTLLWGDADDTELKSNWIMVESGGAFKLGSAAQAFTKRATITLTGSDTAENIMGMGTKCLCAMGGGRLEVYGEDRLSWTKLSSSVAPGSSEVRLLEAGNWRAAEKIVIASSSMNPNEAETVGIKSVSGDGKTLTLETALKYAHYGQLQTFDGKTLDERAEVGLLSRNIVIQGDTASDALKFGGHVMVMDTGSAAQITGVEFKRMGQFNHLGRYPVHFHKMRDASGSFVKNASVHDSFQRGIVVHATDGVRVERNVIFNTPGHNYAIEDGSERGNTFNQNLGLLPRATVFTVDGLKDQRDEIAANFWFRTAAASVTNNAAAGGNAAGFWFDMGFVDGNNATKAMLKFQDNTVHSQQSIKQGDAETWAIWHTDGFVPSSEGVLNLERVTAYKNARAIETNGRGVVSSSMLADNGRAITNLMLRDSTVVSRSANTDSSEEWGMTGMFAYGGFANAENVTWIGFQNGRAISSTLACGIEYPRFSNKGAKLIDSAPSAGCGDVIQSDRDGTFSGMGQASKLVAGGSNFGLITSACQKRGDVAICPNYDYRTLGVTYPLGPNERFSNDAWHVDVVRDEDGDRVSPNHFRWISYVIPGKTYRLEVKSANAGDAAVYPLSKLQFVNLGLNTGENASAELLPGAVNTEYDAAWITRSVKVSTPIPTGTYRIRFCKYGTSCDNDPGKWPQLNPSSSLTALDAQSESGFFADTAKLNFKFFGGDTLRFERL
jgi:G8 domain